MTDTRQLALDYAHRQNSTFIKDLAAFVRIPSISTDPQHKTDMHRAAEWVAGQLDRLKFSRVEIFPTPLHPIIYGETLQAGKQAPTLLIYGHYDVQPAEPLQLWQSPAFDPEQRGDNLYGRGASDMKGQVVASLKALESIINTSPLPINVKVLFEGEEEIGSPSLDPFIASHAGLLACDAVLNPDGGMVSQDLPTIIYALRGLAYFELRVNGPAHDLHSGVFGGSVLNPAQALCDLIAGMHDHEGRITLPGFYDSVLPLDEAERLALVRLPMGEDYYKKQTGAPALWGEAGFTPVERVGARPTLDVNGILSGFTGEGGKTVIPASAMAKISMRLVPDQDPAVVRQQLMSYLEANAPQAIRWELITMSGGRASISERDTPAVHALQKALEAVWGIPPVFKREGGSIPVVATMQKFLGVDSVLTGFGLPDDNIHAPNEKLHLPTWTKGIDALIHFYFNLVELQHS
jgi:acetylornithine deacetylase/succinyl-diaminopimelate desuccinylase-like protein